MQNQNGIQIFEKDEALPALPEGLSDNYAPDVVSEYGFKIDSSGLHPRWIRASKDDFVASEAQRLGIPPSDVKGSSCTQNGPRSCDFGPC
jgi:hypothetical protein